MRGDIRQADDNPAGRLFNVLHQALFIDTNASALDVWVEILLGKKRDPEDLDASEEQWSSSELREVMIRLADLHRLLDEAIQRAQEYEIPIEVYRQHLESLRKAIAPGAIDARWSQARQGITEVGLVSLSAISQQLSRLAPDGTVPKEQLETLLSEVNSLIESFLKCEEIESSLRIFAVTQLRKVREAIELYHLRGPVALREALESIVGATQLRPLDSKEMPEKGRKLFDRFKRTIETLHQTVIVSEKARKVVEALPPILGYLVGGQ